jgi:hypothetical protein
MMRVCVLYSTRDQNNEDKSSLGNGNEPVKDGLQKMLGKNMQYILRPRRRTEE